MRKFKRLNRKGFTLIELLAVIVILAVVMGVASTSVLNAMNNSRKSSLQNSALSAADAFRTAYAEYSMGGQTSILGYTGNDLTDLLGGTPKTITKTVADKLNITVSDGTNKGNYTSSSSYVYFDGKNFLVCLSASSDGSYYVAASIGSVDGNKGAKAVTESVSIADSNMWACSDNTHSWK